MGRGPVTPLKQPHNVGSRLTRFARSLLTHRYNFLFFALLAVALTSSSLTIGLLVDDYYHRAVLLGSRAFGDLLDDPMDIFRFFDGDPERYSAAERDARSAHFAVLRQLMIREMIQR